MRNAYQRKGLAQSGRSPFGAELAYRGDDCNCQTRLVYGKQ